MTKQPEAPAYMKDAIVFFDANQGWMMCVTWHSNGKWIFKLHADGKEWYSIRQATEEDLQKLGAAPSTERIECPLHGVMYGYCSECVRLGAAPSSPEPAKLLAPTDVTSDYVCSRCKKSVSENVPCPYCAPVACPSPTIPEKPLVISVGQSNMTMCSEDARNHQPQFSLAPVAASSTSANLSISPEAAKQFSIEAQFPDGVIAETPAPVPMTLFCPFCGVQHVDEGEWATRPHKTHQCQSCKKEWRLFEYPTVGVAPVPVEGAREWYKTHVVAEVGQINADFYLDQKRVEPWEILESFTSSRIAHVTSTNLIALQRSEARAEGLQIFRDLKANEASEAHERSLYFKGLLDQSEARVESQAKELADGKKEVAHFAKQNLEWAETATRLQERTETAEASLADRDRELRKAAEDAASWKSHFEMYRDAWIRELGGWLVPKHHEIDALVLTTRQRCVNLVLGYCLTPHWLGKPTEGYDGWQQAPHPVQDSCREWKPDDSEPNPRAEKAEKLLADRDRKIARLRDQMDVHIANANSAQRLSEYLQLENDTLRRDIKARGELDAAKLRDELEKKK